jgi:stress response protein YsnF
MLRVLSLLVIPTNILFMKSDEDPGHQAVASGSLVFDAVGQQAHVVSCKQSNGTAQIVLQRPHGKQLRLPQEMMVAREDGSYLLPFAFSDIDAASFSHGEKHVIPVIREELQVGKRVVDTGRGIRVHQQIVERTEVVDEPLQEDVLELTRVAVDKTVDPGAVPLPRQEGETLIVPVLEEVLVVQRQLRLKEELHITRHKREVHAPQTVVLKSQQVSIERFDEKRESRGTTPLSNNPKEDTNNPGVPAR